jgi:excisionase family DNA binding protein
MDETFLTTEQVLGYLRVNLRTVYRLIKAGKIPAVRVGRQWRFRQRDIDAWLDSQRPRGGSIAADVAPAAGDRAQDRRASRARVLVVDDEASIRDTLAEYLRISDYALDVDTAADGRSALERLRTTPYDLLITDLKMPGMDGLTLVREAKRYRADLPFIVITGYSTEATAIDAANLGNLAGYLTKPIKPRQAERLVTKALHLEE